MHATNASVRAVDVNQVCWTQLAPSLAVDECVNAGDDANRYMWLIQESCTLPVPGREPVELELHPCKSTFFGKVEAAHAYLGVEGQPPVLAMFLEDVATVVWRADYPGGEHEVLYYICTPEGTATLYYGATDGLSDLNEYPPGSLMLYSFFVATPERVSQDLA